VYSVHVTQAFQDWLDALRDTRAQIRISARLRLAEAGNFGDWKPVGGSISEMRVDIGAGYRLYFMRHGRHVIVMLGGGDKSTQRRDIENAHRIATEWEFEP
jgi:putative addiction module killer protein